jgi:hypothetical protein
MGNRPIFAGAPTVEVDLSEWEKLHKNAGRVAAACDYIRKMLEPGNYFGNDDARIVLALLGEGLYKTERKSNETEKEEESE